MSILIKVFERRGLKKGLMYHGTSSVLLPNIMKHGLQKNPPQRVYDPSHHRQVQYLSDPKYATMGEGIYFSPYRDTASNAAMNAIKIFGGEPMVITIQYILGSGYMDEDEIVSSIMTGMDYAYDHMWDYFDMDYDEEKMKEFLNHFSKEEHKHTMIDIMNNSILSIIEDKIGEVTPRGANAIDNVIEIVYNTLVKMKETTDTADNLYDLKQYLLRDENFRMNIKAMLAGIHRQFNTNIFIPRNIGFRGKTRIIQIDVSDDTVYKGKEA